MHVEKQVNKMVAPDGLYWAKGSDGPGVLIVDKDSGNDYGERKYALPLIIRWNCVIRLLDIFLLLPEAN